MTTRTRSESLAEEAEYAADNAKVLCAIEEGDDHAKTELAWFKLSGHGGVVIDAEGAVKLLEEQVKNKDDRAMWMLGMCFEYGIGCEQDLSRAKELYKESSEAENEVGETLEFQCNGGKEKTFRRSVLSEKNNMFE